MLFLLLLWLTALVFFWRNPKPLLKRMAEVPVIRETGRHANFHHLVSMPAYWDKLAVLMVIKVLYAIVVGFVLDFVLRGVLPKGLRGGYTGHADEVDCHEEHSDAEGNEKPIWQAALRHTLEIFVFIFAFSLVFGMIVEGVGEDVFAEVLGGMGFFQPVVAALVGLIPNCSASVLLTQLYVEGADYIIHQELNTKEGNGGLIAVEKGKKQYDKRESLKEKDDRRDVHTLAEAIKGADVFLGLSKGYFDRPLHRQPERQ